LGASSSAGCSPHRVVDLEATNLAFDVAVAIVIDAHHAPVSVSPPFALDGGQVAGGPVRVPILLDRQSLLIAGLSNDDIARVEPAFLANGVGAIRASIAPPPRRPTRRREGTSFVTDMAIPSSAQIDTLVDVAPARLRAATATEASALEGVTLTIPINPDDCGGSQPSVLSPFAEDAMLLPGAMSAGALDRILRIDADRVVALARVPATLYLFDRSSKAGSPRAKIDLGLASSRFAIATGLAAAPAGPTNDTARVVVVGSTAPTCPAMNASCNRPTLWELLLSGTDLKITSTSTLGEAPGIAFTSVAIDALGRTIVTGEHGRLLVRDAGQASFHRAPPLATTSTSGDFADLDLVASIADPARPHAVAGVFRLFFGDVTGSDITVDRLMLPGGQTLRFTWLEQIASQPSIEIWAIGHPSSLFRRLDDAPTASITLALPSGYAPCADSDLQHPIEYRAVVGSGDFAYVVTECNAVLRVRRADLCASLVTAPNGDVLLTPDLRSAYASSSMITFGGAEGALYELPVP
jgi:hypothetical protein